MSARSNISLVVEEPAWRRSGIDLARVHTAARLAFARTCGHERESTVLLTNDKRLRELNARFRGKDVPTNVLSFPAIDNRAGYLGDVAIAYGITNQEAAKAGITFQAHTLHLVVHGILHLLGYDHVRAREAKLMERLEIAILSEMEVSNSCAHAATSR